MVESRRKILFPNVTDEEWNDWHWQVKNRIETLEDLKKYIELTPEEEEGVKACLGTLRMAITPYYLSLIQPGDPHDPVRLQAIPTAKELHQADSDLLDPLHEDEDSPAPGLTHRYPDRCLLLITDQCSMYCRHCTRRRFAGQNDAGLPVDQVDQAIEYIRNTPQIRDVLLSGGDALLVSDERLEYIISKLREIPHVEIVRIGSRTPVSKGIEIIEGLRGHTSGFCVPTFVVDAPGGGGKTPVMPQYIISQTPKKVILRNYEGVITTYTEPEHYTDCQCDYCTGKKKKELMGVAGLERGQALSMEPANLERHKRSHHEE